MPRKKKVNNKDRKKSLDELIGAPNDDEINYYWSDDVYFFTQNQRKGGRTFFQKIKSLFSKNNRHKREIKNIGIPTITIRKCIDEDIIIPHLVNSHGSPVDISSNYSYSIRNYKENNELATISIENIACSTKSPEASETGYLKMTNNNFSKQCFLICDVLGNNCKGEEATQTVCVTADVGVQVFSLSPLDGSVEKNEPCSNKKDKNLLNNDNHTVEKAEHLSNNTSDIVEKEKYLSNDKRHDMLNESQEVYYPYKDYKAQTKKKIRDHKNHKDFLPASKPQVPRSNEVLRKSSPLNFNNQKKMSKPVRYVRTTKNEVLRSGFQKNSQISATTNKTTPTVKSYTNKHDIAQQQHNSTVQQQLNSTLQQQHNSTDQQNEAQLHDSLHIKHINSYINNDESRKNEAPDYHTKYLNVKDAVSLNSSFHIEDEDLSSILLLHNGSGKDAFKSSYFFKENHNTARDLYSKRHKNKNPNVPSKMKECQNCEKLLYTKDLKHKNEQTNSWKTTSEESKIALSHKDKQFEQCKKDSIAQIQPKFLVKEEHFSNYSDSAGSVEDNINKPTILSEESIVRTVESQSYSNNLCEGLKPNISSFALTESHSKKTTEKVPVSSGIQMWKGQENPNATVWHPMTPQLNMFPKIQPEGVDTILPQDLMHFCEESNMELLHSRNKEQQQIGCDITGNEESWNSSPSEFPNSISTEFQQNTSTSMNNETIDSSSNKVETSESENYKQQLQEFRKNILGELQELTNPLHSSQKSDDSFQRQPFTPLNNTIIRASKSNIFSSYLNISVQQFDALMSNRYITLSSNTVFKVGNCIQPENLTEHAESKTDFDLEKAQNGNDIQEILYPQNIQSSNDPCGSNQQQHANLNIQNSNSEQMKVKQRKLINSLHKTARTKTTSKSSKHETSNGTESQVTGSNRSKTMSQSSRKTTKSSKSKRKQVMPRKPEELIPNSENLHVHHKGVHGVFTGNISRVHKKK